MKKLKKNFLDKKSTVEAMTDSCIGKLLVQHDVLHSLRQQFYSVYQGFYQ